MWTWLEVLFFSLTCRVAGFHKSSSHFFHISVGCQWIYFECQGSASCELFSVTNLETGDKVLINDPVVANSIKSFLVIPPRITSIVKSGSNVNIQWAYGNPPFQVQFKNNLSSATWSNSGGTTSSSRASIAISPGAAFFRIVGSP